MKHAIGIAALALTLATSVHAGETVVYGTDYMILEGYRAFAENPKGTVIILPTWNGISDYEKDRAEMLAEMGYNAFAADLHGRGKLPQTLNEKNAALAALFRDRWLLRSILRSAIEVADSLENKNLVVLGYSMGGGAAIELVHSGLGNELGIDGYAIFSGRLSDPEERSIPDGLAPVFVAHGSADQRIPVSSLTVFGDDLDMADVNYTFKVYQGAGHLFSAFGFPNYNQDADAASWQALSGFLADRLD